MYFHVHSKAPVLFKGLSWNLAQMIITLGQCTENMGQSRNLIFKVTLEGQTFETWLCASSIFPQSVHEIWLNEISVPWTPVLPMINNRLDEKNLQLMQLSFLRRKSISIYTKHIYCLGHSFLVFNVWIRNYYYYYHKIHEISIQFKVKDRIRLLASNSLEQISNWWRCKFKFGVLSIIQLTACGGRQIILVSVATDFYPLKRSLCFVIIVYMCDTWGLRVGIWWTI